MIREDKVLEKKRGRPAIGKGLQFNSSFRPDLAARIDAWIAAQPEPQPSRSEAIRRLVEKALASEGVAHSDASLDHKIVQQEKAIAEMREVDGPSP